jgi:hypothetical protein
VEKGLHVTEKGWIVYFMDEWNLNLGVTCLNKLLPKALVQFLVHQDPWGPIQSVFISHLVEIFKKQFQGNLK